MKHILRAILLSIVVGLAAAMDNLSTAERSAETCGDPDDTLAWYRLYNANLVTYSYTTDISLLTTLIRGNGYALQTIMGMVFVTQEDPALEDNFVTINATERDVAIANGYTLLPALQTYIYPSAICGSIPMYRLYKSAQTLNFLTTSESERLSAISSGGFSDLGIAGYVLPAGVAASC
ncbi:hypothetical protein MSAN_01593800 [Mycena sanguinolenta]|uniref:DUF5648 domain-containing protein n=1 Tax=Mycena sanguinolenta TaxID=230812 RepID=A0A8H7CY29_9AGAR|nr:hypothetical protein MSAN_01593800 [Mycena sanguinolenta]